jgi:hypothetical protein
VLRKRHPSFDLWDGRGKPVKRGSKNKHTRPVSVYDYDAGALG